MGGARNHLDFGGITPSGSVTAPWLATWRTTSGQDEPCLPSSKFRTAPSLRRLGTRMRPRHPRRDAEPDPPTLPVPRVRLQEKYFPDVPASPADPAPEPFGQEP